MKFLFVVALFFVLFSCKRSSVDQKHPKINVIEIPNLIQEYLVKSQEKKDGSILLSSSNDAWVKITQPDIMLTGIYYDNNFNGKQILGNNIKINGNKVEQTGTNESPCYFIQTRGINQASSNWLTSLWGKHNAVYMSKNKFSSRLNEDSTGTFYAPLTIQMSSPIIDSFMLNKNSNNQIIWNPDINNPNQKVYLFVIYEGDMANMDNPNLASGVTLELFLELPDTGTYTLKPSDIESLPIGGRATVCIARGNYEWITDSGSGETYLISAVTTSNSGPIGIK